MGGSFMWALSCTDILSGWTEVRGIWNCGAHVTCSGLAEIEENLPFGLKGLDTDNGSEFLNWHVVGHYQNREVQVKQTAENITRHAPQGQSARILGPAPAPMHLLRGQYRYRLLIKANRNVNIQKMLDNWLANVKIPSTIKLKVDIDPYSFV